MSINPSSIIPAFRAENRLLQGYTKEGIEKLVQCSASSQESSLFPTLFCSENPFKPFEYERKKYASAWACFYAQQYTDQPDLMALFAQCNDLTQLKALAASHPMTPERRAAWENPHDTEGSKRATLMRMKKELGELVASQAASAEAFTTLFTHDVGSVVIAQCGSTGVVALGSVNKELFARISKQILQLPFEAIEGLCDHKLHILDIGFGVHFPNPFKFLVSCNQLIPLVKEDAGVSYFTLGERYTRNQLMQTAIDNGIEIESLWGDFLKEVGTWEDPLGLVGDVPIGKQSILISNDVLCGTLVKTYDTQQRLMSRWGFMLPLDVEYIALCVHTKVITKEYLYPESGGIKGACGRIFTETTEEEFNQRPLKGALPWLYGRSCTLDAKGTPFTVGCFSPFGLSVDPTTSITCYIGAGAVQRFFFKDEPKDKQSG